MEVFGYIQMETIVYAYTASRATVRRNDRPDGRTVWT
ncbi:hypothetical protein BH24CHL3_BH24CHL3_08800 [soil metagenome]